MRKLLSAAVALVLSVTFSATLSAAGDDSARRYRPQPTPALVSTAAVPKSVPNSKGLKTKDNNVFINSNGPNGDAAIWFCERQHDRRFDLLGRGQHAPGVQPRDGRDQRRRRRGRLRQHLGWLLRGQRQQRLRLRRGRRDGHRRLRRGRRWLLRRDRQRQPRRLRLPRHGRHRGALLRDDRVGHRGGRLLHGPGRGRRGVRRRRRHRDPGVRSLRRRVVRDLGPRRRRLPLRRRAARVHRGVPGGAGLLRHPGRRYLRGRLFRGLRLRSLRRGRDRYLQGPGERPGVVRAEPPRSRRTRSSSTPRPRGARSRPTPAAAGSWSTASRASHSTRPSRW